MKAHRSDPENLRKFVLVEEVECSGGETQSPHARRHSTEQPEKRILEDDDNVYLAQREWKTNGKFVIMDKNTAEQEIIQVCIFTFYDMIFMSKVQTMYLHHVMKINVKVSLEFNFS